jgi:hypothetical protein
MKKRGGCVMLFSLGIRVFIGLIFIIAFIAIVLKIIKEIKTTFIGRFFSENKYKIILIIQTIIIALIVKGIISNITNDDPYRTIKEFTSENAEYSIQIKDVSGRDMFLSEVLVVVTNSNNEKREYFSKPLTFLHGIIKYDVEWIHGGAILTITVENGEKRTIKHPIIWDYIFK